MVEEDCSYDPRHLARQFKVHNGKIMAAIRHFDDIHALVTHCCWRTRRTYDSLRGEPSLTDVQALREAVVVMKSNYLHISDRHHLLILDYMYHDALKEEEKEVDRITHELDITQNYLNRTQMALQESKMQVAQISY